MVIELCSSHNWNNTSYINLYHNIIYDAREQFQSSGLAEKGMVCCDACRHSEPSPFYISSFIFSIIRIVTPVRRLICRIDAPDAINFCITSFRS